MHKINQRNKRYRFNAILDKIGINPFVFLPENILLPIIENAKQYNGKIPVKGIVNNLAYQQTLIKYSGEWRLYINTKMLKDSPKRIGEIIKLTIEMDYEDRIVPTHPDFFNALEKNHLALEVFQNLSPSLKKEIVRYLSRLKTQKSIDKNITRAINFLQGKESFVGRKSP